MTFHLTSGYLSHLSYSGPVSLSCDDTKLHPSYHTYWDPAKQTHYLIGGTDGPMAVANVEGLQDLLKSSETGDKVTKVSFLHILFCHNTS